MQKVILYIQPQLRTTTTAQDYVRVDLMEEELIELTQVIQDVRDIDKVFTDYSKTFNLPASKTNNKIFKWWYNPDVEGFDNQLMANARIELNHFHFKFGKIKLEEVVMRNGEASMYKATFFGDTVSLSNLMGEDQLSNLSWLNNFNFTASNANVLAGLNAGLDFTVDSVSYTDAIIYPLITHSQRYIYDSSGNGADVGNISTYNNDKNRRGILPEDLKPAILVKHIIKAIEEQYNITFKTSEFLDSAPMNSLYMWLHRDKGGIKSEYFKIVTNETFNCISNPISFSNACTFFGGTASPKYNDGIYQFIGVLNDGVSSKNIYSTQIIPAVATDIYTIQIINLVNNDVVATLENVTGTQTIDAAYACEQDQITFNNLTNAINVNLGETVQLATKIITNSTFQFGIVNTIFSQVFDTSTAPPTIVLHQAEYTSVSSAITTASDIEITNQIPEIKVIDFLKGLFKMFNLTAYVDFDGKIVVQTLDTYYAGGDTHNLTEYIKTDQHTVAETLPFTDVDLQYSDAKSFLAQQFKLLNNRRYGEAEYIADASKKSSYKIELPYEHMLYERLTNLNTSGTAALSDVQYGLFLDDDNKPAIGQPLLFYGIYRTSISNPLNFVESTRPEDGTLPPVGLHHTVNNFWMPHNASTTSTVSTPPPYNLNFGSEINSYTLTDYSGGNNSLFQLYYNNYITRVFNKRTRLYKFSAILPLGIILKLSLDDKIIINDRTYTINKMSIKLQSGETSFELLNEAP